MRPLWYDHPDREDLYTADDEYMLGPDLLAAPVLEEGASERDVLLPPGEWRDAWTCNEHLVQRPSAQRQQLCEDPARGTGISPSENP